MKAQKLPNSREISASYILHLFYACLLSRMVVIFLYKYLYKISSLLLNQNLMHKFHLLRRGRANARKMLPSVAPFRSDRKRAATHCSFDYMSLFPSPDLHHNTLSNSLGNGNTVTERMQLLKYGKVSNLWGFFWNHKSVVTK